MNLLNNIFEAYEAHDFRLLDSYLRMILSEFITQFHSPSSKGKGLQPLFNIFNPSKVLTVKKNTDFFDALYKSEDEAQKPESQKTEGETKLSFSRDLSPKIAPASADEFSPSKKLQVKPEWLKGLLKVFSLLDSKAIKKLLLLLEHPKETTRKMIMVLFQILLKKTESKIHFVEKCAIGFSPGVYVVTRVKFVHSITQNHHKVFQCFMEIKRHFRTLRLRMELENKKLEGGCF